MSSAFTGGISSFHWQRKLPVNCEFLPTFYNRFVVVIDWWKKHYSSIWLHFPSVPQQETGNLNSELFFRIDCSKPSLLLLPQDTYTFGFECSTQRLLRFDICPLAWKDKLQEYIDIGYHGTKCKINALCFKSLCIFEIIPAPLLFISAVLPTGNGSRHLDIP